MSQALEPGAIVAGRYRLERLLGQGGMGGDPHHQTAPALVGGVMDEAPPPKLCTPETGPAVEACDFPALR
jgi:hypothetical protein